MSVLLEMYLCYLLLALQNSDDVKNSIPCRLQQLIGNIQIYNWQYPGYKTLLPTAFVEGFCWKMGYPNFDGNAATQTGDIIEFRYLNKK